MAGWTDAIPWIVAAVGWGATHLLSEARERRKEVRAQVDKVLDRLAKIEEAARDFHSADSFDQKKSLFILSEIHRLERILTRIPGMNIDNLVSVIILHRRAITYQNFDMSSFQRLDLGGELIGDINAATQDFEDEIEAQYRLNYPANFPYFQLRSRISRKPAHN
jgi:hypothetical protein